MKTVMRFKTTLAVISGAMRAPLALGIALGVSVWAAAAQACVPLPPPYWPGLVGNTDVSIFVGRVDRIESLPDQAYGASVISRSRAHVDMLEPVQGAPSRETAEIDGATEIRVPPGSDDRPVCLDYQSFDQDDLVVVVENLQAKSRNIYDARLAAAVPQLAPYLEKYR